MSDSKDRALLRRLVAAKGDIDAVQHVIEDAARHLDQVGRGGRKTSINSKRHKLRWNGGELPATACGIPLDVTRAGAFTSANTGNGVKAERYWALVNCRNCLRTSPA